MRRSFTLEYWRDDGWFVGRLKEVPGVFSQAKTLKELEANIRDAYKMMMATSLTPKLSVKHREKEVIINV